MDLDRYPLFKYAFDFVYFSPRSTINTSYINHDTKSWSKPQNRHLRVLMCQMEASTSNIFTLLNSKLEPPYLLLQLAAHLDNYSLLALLQTYPQWQQHAVLITDHKWPALFCTLNVKRTFILAVNANGQNGGNGGKEDTDADPFDYYDPKCHTQKIKLLEISSPMTMESFLPAEAGKPSDEVLQRMFKSATTFAYFRLHVARSAGIDVIRKMPFHFHSSCQSFFAEVPYSTHSINTRADPLRPFFKPGPIYSPDSNLVQYPPGAFKNLLTLRIEGFRIVSNLVLPSLHSLSIVFRTPPRDRSRLSVSRLSIPSISYFVIHYDGLLPYLSEIDVTRSTSTSPESIFELANIGAIEGNLISPRHQLHYTPTRSDEACLDLLFLSAGGFTTVSLIGIPHFILHENFISLSQLEHLHIQTSLFEMTQCMDPRSLPATLPNMKTITLWDCIQRKGEIKCNFMSELEHWVELRARQKTQGR